MEALLRDPTVRKLMEDQVIIKMVEENHSTRTVARYLGKKTSTIRNRISKLGLSRNPDIGRKLALARYAAKRARGIDCVEPRFDPATGRKIDPKTGRTEDRASKSIYERSFGHAHQAAQEHFLGVMTELCSSEQGRQMLESCRPTS